MPRGFKTHSSVSAAVRAEEQTGVRFCTTCDKAVPLSEFSTFKRRYMCIKHYREIMRHYTTGDHNKRAFNSLRCRAYQDMTVFGQKRMFMSRKQILAKLTDEQQADYSNHALIPKNPDQPLVESNSIVVTSAQRAYVVSNWKKSRDPEQYLQDLISVLKTPRNQIDLN